MSKITNKLKQTSLSILATSILTAGIIITIPNISQADLKVTGDFRFRLESDWDSKKSDGITEREDRTRARIRARLNINYDHENWAFFGARLRSGSDDSHQSPHLTILDFNENDTGDADFNFAKWFFKLKKDNTWMWVGRNSLPFWKQNELFWSDNVMPAGMAVGLNFGSGTSVAVNAGYFSLPVGMKEFSGNLGLGQIVVSTKTAGATLTGAAGLLTFDGNSDDEDAVTLLNGNGLRDYSIWIASLQAKFKVGSLPLKIGVDFIHNDEDYDNKFDSFAYANRDETDGYVGSIHLGNLKVPGDWLLSYYYAHIETLAVNASYAQDDWVRWGSPTESRLSNMEGHEIRVGYQFTKQFNTVARLYIVEAITNEEDGNRFRLDFNYKF